jgi:threonine/homoserine/homoserine lactone efflux protein
VRHLALFVGVAALIIVVPGPDTALVTKNAVLHGRRAALGTAVGVTTGLALWTLASAVGIASLLRSSEIAFTVVKLVGAAYLVWLGVQALLTARRRHAAGGGGSGAGTARGRLSAGGAARQGVLSNLSNPKIAALFTSLLPQFVTPGRSVLAPSLALGGLFAAMTLVWLVAYALAASKASSILERPRVAAAVDRLTGVVLIALGLRLATEHR